MKPGKPPKDDEREMKRTVLAALFFGIRLFKSSPEFDEDRERAAAEATRDADALLGELDKVPS